MKTKLLRLIIEKLFCKHFWNTHKIWKTSEASNVTKITEILICNKCGKFKRIHID